MLHNKSKNNKNSSLAFYRDANSEVDSFFHKLALSAVMISAVIVSVLGAVNFISSNSRAVDASVSASPNITAVVQSSPNTPKPTPVPTERPRTVLLDPGHGGFDPGTSGTWTGAAESDINLEITYDIKELLESKGYAVLMTRTDKGPVANSKVDDMHSREVMIQRSGADIFISIHQNAVDDSSISGCEVYYHETQPDSRLLAEAIEHELSLIPDAAPSRGVKLYGHMLTKYMRYSILIECGFLTNQAEEAKLVSDAYQKQLAEAVVNGIETFYENDYNKD